MNSYLLIATWGQSYKEKGYQYVYGYLTLEKRTMDGQMTLSVNKEMHINFKEYLIAVRMDKARAFKKVTGLSPSQYRNGGM